MVAESKTRWPLASLRNNTDILVAMGVISVVLVMVIPLPAPLLDLLLAFNIALSLVTLLVAMYTLQPLEFSIFPSLLLVLTLFRLALNISSTRLILLHGDQGPGAAGEVIRAFGNFVVGGNYVVGVIVFCILIVINFVVITKGAGRIAEVAARFTLDAMPGKQLAIDADLNAGILSEQEARRRRQTIQEEADFYGAMDGASKFVRGDAIAGILITVVNILGGIVIGVLQQGLLIQEALQTYTILSVGDGLVSQIPSLIISTAAGIVVTKVSNEMPLGQQFSQQFFANSRALGTTGGMLFLMGLIPGLPQFPMLTLAALCGTAAYSMRRTKKRLAESSTELLQTQAEPPQAAPDPMELLAPIDLLELEVGYGLIALVDSERDGELLERIKAVRRQVAQELGVLIPPLRIRDNLQRRPGEYAILIKGIEVAQGELMIGHVLAMHPGDEPGEIAGIPTTEPAFGLPAYWINASEKEQAQFAGYTVVDLATVVITHLTEVIKRHLHELLSREEVQKLLKRFAQDYPKVVEELVPTLLSLGGVQKVLQNLLRENLPIRDMLTILETLADYAPLTKDPLVLTEYVRQGLARTITKMWQTPDGDIPVLVMAFDLEDMFTKSLHHTEHGSYLNLEPALSQRFITELTRAVERLAGQTAILLTGPLIRPHIKRLTEAVLPHLVVLSHNDIVANVRIKNLGVVKV